jgi:hypothetical protein
MIFEVALAELPLRFGNGSDARLERFRCDRTGGEKVFQRSFLFDELVTQRNGFLFHGIEQPPDLGALIGGQGEAIAELEHVAGTGISIELGSKSQAHTASCAKIVDLLLRQRIDGELFKTGIGLAGLCAGCAAGEEESGSKQKEAVHEAGSIKSSQPMSKHQSRLRVTPIAIE